MHVLAELRLPRHSAHELRVRGGTQGVAADTLGTGVGLSIRSTWRRRAQALFEKDIQHFSWHCRKLLESCRRTYAE